MQTETQPANDDEQRVLRLRPAVWRNLCFLLGYCALQEWLFSLWKHAPSTPASLWGVVVWLTVVAYERRTCPPVLRFWEDGSRFRLQVRKKSNGITVFRSEQDTLAAADLRMVEFGGCNLQGVCATNADFRGADLSGANLSDADLIRARLESANLRGARLCRTRLSGANLEGADLRGADFRAHDLIVSLTEDFLTGTDFRGAYYCSATRWPRGFDPAARGCVLVEAEHSKLPIPTYLAPSEASVLPIPRGAAPAEQGVQA